LDLKFECKLHSNVHNCIRNPCHWHQEPNIPVEGVVESKRPSTSMSESASSKQTSSQSKTTSSDSPRQHCRIHHTTALTIPCRRSQRRVRMISVQVNHKESCLYKSPKPVCKSFADGLRLARSVSGILQRQSFVYVSK
jgi:hypothetical protein